MRGCRLTAPCLVTVLVCGILLTCASAFASEVQLAGVRLGQHAYNVLQVYGQPECVIAGATGVGSIGGGGGGGGAAAAGPGPGGGEMGGGMPGMGAEGAGGGGMGGGDLMGMVGAAMGAMGGGMPGMGGGEMGGGMPGMDAGGMGGGAPAGGGGAGGTGRFASQNDVPDWAAPLRMQMTPREHMWCYRRGENVVGIVLDRDGYITSIAVSGKKCAWARTAMGEPLRTVKLGDSMKTVVERYGYPEGFNGTGDGYSRDLVLTYSYGNNISFRLTDMKVRSIEIWEAGLRGTAPVRLPDDRVGAGAGPDMPPALLTPGGFRH